MIIAKPRVDGAGDMDAEEESDADHVQTRTKITRFGSTRDARYSNSCQKIFNRRTAHGKTAQTDRFGRSVG